MLVEPGDDIFLSCREIRKRDGSSTYVRTLATATATAEREATTGEKDVLFKREGRRKVFEIERAIDKPENPPDIFIVSSWPPDYSVQ